MTVKTIVRCDGSGCSIAIEFDFESFDMGDFPDLNWSYDADNEFYYCPSCVKKMIRSGELGEFE